MATAAAFPLENTSGHEEWTIRHTTLSCFDAKDDWVVFVHGTPWSSDVSRPLAKALHAVGNYNIVLCDLAGYGQSQQWSAPETDHTEQDISVMMQGNVLAGLLGHLGLLGKTIKLRVVAHDIVGGIAFRAHVLHGCEYESLCLLNTNCVLPWGDKLYNLVRSSPKVFEEMPEAVFEGA